MITALVGVWVEALVLSGLTVRFVCGVFNVPAEFSRFFAGTLLFLFRVDERVDVRAGASGVCTVSMMYLPGSIFSILQLPIFTRTKRKVGWPTAAVIRRTWRLRPSLITISIHWVGIFLRSRIGVSRAQSFGAGMSLTCAGRVITSLSATP